jgi:hypothetical protein
MEEARILVVPVGLEEKASGKGRGVGILQWWKNAWWSSQ